MGAVGDTHHRNSMPALTTRLFYVHYYGMVREVVAKESKPTS